MTINFMSVFDDEVGLHFNVKYDDSSISIPGNRWQVRTGAMNKQAIVDFINAECGTAYRVVELDQ